MIKKEGFTLIEVLTVIIVLGIIATITVPNVIKIINNNRIKAFELQKDILIDLATEYSMTRPKIIKRGYVTLKELKDAKMIKKKLKDIKGKELTDNYIVSLEHKDVVQIATNRSTDGRIEIENAKDLPIRKLTLYGKSEQEGNPTSGSPSEILSVEPFAIISNGKNIFDGEIELGRWSYKKSSLSKKTSLDGVRSVNKIKVVEKATYTISGMGDRSVYGDGYVVFIDDENKNIDYINVALNPTFTTPKGTKYIVWYQVTEEGIDYNPKIQLELGEVATSYESFKGVSIIELPFTLRSIKDYDDNIFQDEIQIDYQKKEAKLIRRVGEIVLNGTETYTLITTENEINTIMFRYKPNSPMNIVAKYYNAWSDYFVTNTNLFDDDQEGVRGANDKDSDVFRFRILRSQLNTEDVNGFKTWLSNNNVTILYKLDEEEIEILDYEDYKDLQTYAPYTQIYTTSKVKPEIEVELYTD